MGVEERDGNERADEGDVAPELVRLRERVAELEAILASSRRKELESLATLAGGLAHDFNNLLTGVLAGASLLRAAGVDPAHADRIAEQIELAAIRARDVCAEMLAFAGRSLVRVESFELGALAEEAIALVASSSPTNVSLVVERRDRGHRVRGDRGQLTQAIVNLAKNSVEAIGAERPGVVTILTEHVDEVVDAADLVEWNDAPGAHVCLSVSDDGPGIGREMRTRIFDPFFSTKFQGRGLGLPAVLGTTRRHGGALRVTSEPGVGTSVRVYLAVAAASSSSSAPRPSRAPGPACSLLIVDDDEMVRRAAELMARSNGMSPSLAASGLEAIARIEADPSIDVVLLDVTMPGMDGFETLRAIRALRADVRVILSSGYAPRDSDLGVRHDYDAFLEKPYRAEDLRDVVAGVLSNGVVDATCRPGRFVLRTPE